MVKKRRNAFAFVLVLLIVFGEGCGCILGKTDNGDQKGISSEIERRKICPKEKDSVWRFKPMAYLSNDLVPQFSDGSEMVVVRVLGSGSVVGPDGNQETGNVTLQVAEMLGGKLLSVGRELKVAFERDAIVPIRVRKGFNYWNQLSLTAGEMLIFAGKLKEPPDIWEGISAQKVETADAPEIKAARKCFEIENFSGPAEEKRKMLEDALVAEQNLLKNYSLDCIGRRRFFDCAIGCEMINKAMMVKGTDPDYRIALGGVLADIYFFEPEKGAEDATNRLVIVVLSRELVRDTTQEDREQWIDLLASCVNSEFSEDEQKNNQIRNELIRSIPNVNQVASAISNYAKSAETEDREIADELLAIWKKALSDL